LVLAMTLGVVAGCGEKSKKVTKTDKQGSNAGMQDDHHHEGPHGGHVIELEGGYHAELTHDDDTKLVAIYLLGGDAKKPVMTEDKDLMINLTVDGKPQQYTLTAAPQAGDPEGQASRFELKDEKLVDSWDAPKSTGRVEVDIGGKRYSGDIAAPGHEHEKK
jgi:hypothetical protein